MKDNAFLKEEYKNQPERRFDYEPYRIYRFDNIFRFMNFCYKYKWNPKNSITYYDDEEECMYIKHI